MSVLKSYPIHGVTPYQVHSMMLNLYNYPPEYLDTLDEYFSYTTDPSYLADRIVEGTLSKKGHTFMVVYHKCTPSMIKHAQHIQLSFRVPKKDFGLCSYVLVRVIQFTSPTPAA